MKKINLFLIALLALLSISCNKEDVVSIGDPYQGGIVFFIDATGEHGKVCSDEDLTSTGNPLGSYIWEHAVMVCDKYEGNGFADWYLPSKDEWTQIDSRLRGDVAFKAHYWSSTTQGDSMAWMQSFSLFGFPNGYYGLHSQFNVRAAREF